MGRVVARAPASTANLGPGFDAFGLAIDAFYDEVALSKGENGIRIAESGGTPASAAKNTAGLVVRAMAKKFGAGDGVDIFIKKGVRPGMGMGSSAASASAAAVAFDALFGLGLGPNELVRLAGEGERASAGAIHYDNVAASVLGGFVIVRQDPLDVLQIGPPRDLVLCLAVPDVIVPRKKTQASRALVPKSPPMSKCTQNVSHAAAMAAGFMAKDAELVGRSVRDAIVEPARQRMIPGFARIKKGALAAGAMGVTISGAGPSVAAFCTKDADLDGICRAMKRGFASAGTRSEAFSCRPSRGAAVRRAR